MHFNFSELSLSLSLRDSPAAILIHLNIFPFILGQSYIQTSTGRNISFPIVGIILLSFSIKCNGRSTIWPWIFFNSLRACSGSVSAIVFSDVCWFSSAKLNTKSEGMQLNTYKLKSNTPSQRTVIKALMFYTCTICFKLSFIFIHSYQLTRYICMYSKNRL